MSDFEGSLLEEYMEDCVIIDRRTVPDGYGGFTNVWAEGAPIKAAITKDNSISAEIAAAEDVKTIYKITTTRNINLQFHQIVKRVSDGKIFRCTTDGDDAKTPSSASIDMRQVTAEEWVLTDEQGTSNS